MAYRVEGLTTFTIKTTFPTQGILLLASLPDGKHPDCPETELTCHRGDLLGDSLRLPLACVAHRSPPPSRRPWFWPCTRLLSRRGTQFQQLPPGRHCLSNSVTKPE